jgi:hypothetical protein
VRSARALGRYKRVVMGVGLAGIYVVWAIFVWCDCVRGGGDPRQLRIRAAAG